MKYTLVDIIPGVIENVTTGTCDMCMQTRDLDIQYYHVKDENDIEYKINGCYYDHFGVDHIYLDNVAHFAGWLQHQDLEKPKVYDFFWLRDVVRLYNKAQENTPVHHIDDHEDNQHDYSWW